jgi:hypothetical protein
MAQAVTRWRLIAEVRIRARVSPCGICGGQNGTRICFSISYLDFTFKYHSTMALKAYVSAGG